MPIRPQILRLLMSIRLIESRTLQYQSIFSTFRVVRGFEGMSTAVDIKLISIRLQIHH